MNYLNSRRRQRGITLVEALLVLALAALLASIAYVTYGSGRKDVRLNDATTGTITLIARINQLYGNSSDYTTLTPTLLSQTGIVPSQFQVADNEGTLELRDLFGNPLEINGGSGSYALAFNGLDRESCSKLAPALASIAFQINAGAAADVNVTNGAVNGGQEYKAAAGTVNVANLAAGCNAAPARLAIVVRN